MTQQEQFEADYLTAFPGMGPFLLKFDDGDYVCRDIRDAHAVWLQQAKRHEAEKAELVAAPKDWMAVVNAVSAYLDDYEYRHDSGSYTPTDNERAIIEDAIHGLVEDDAFVAAYTAPPAQAVSLTTPTLNASCVPEGQSCAITPCQYQDGSCAYCDDEGGTLFQSTKQACEWLAGRFEFSGIGDGVARSYAKHLRTMLAAAPEPPKP